MKIEVIIPEEVKEAISTVGNVTKQKSAQKIFNALIRKEKYSNKFGWFEVSSKYLHKINGRYKTIIDHFIDNNIFKDEKYMPIKNIKIKHISKHDFTLDHNYILTGWAQNDKLEKIIKVKCPSGKFNLCNFVPSFKMLENQY